MPVTNGLETAINRSANVSVICSTTAPKSIPFAVTKSAVQISLYPNPVRDKLILSIKSNKIGVMQVKIVSKNGNPVKQFTLRITKGYNKQTINISNLANDLYMLHADLNGELTGVKFLKQ